MVKNKDFVYFIALTEKARKTKISDDITQALRFGIEKNISNRKIREFLGK